MVTIKWQTKATKQIRKMAKKDAERIYKSVDSLNNWPTVTNVKPLKNHKYDYRLRVGNYRVMLNVIDGNITVINIEEVKKRDGRTY